MTLLSSIMVKLNDISSWQHKGLVILINNADRCTPQSIISKNVATI